ncbi:MAG TPA: pitrilysin family protein [Candidatus Dormibacteraeota bacterium]|nr:pitrilysin family protein [Candidatus Dormibacteraeota bacterium]
MTNVEDRLRKTVLPNGLVVISETMPHFRSVSVGIWVRTGSRREPEAVGGISHFIEHMVFKGTERRSCEEIAGAVDSVGGMLDAFTTKEIVCFSAKVLDEHLPLAFDVISDMVLRPLFAAPELEREKRVVLEEIKMDEDNPETSINELFLQGFWKGHALGRPILGTRVTVDGFEREGVLDWFRKCYVPNEILIAAAGNVEHARLVDLAMAAFGSLNPATNGYHESVPEPHALIQVRRKRSLEQAHVFVGVPAFAAADPRRYPMAVLNSILGSGMSSRLFQNIRERQGLAYAVMSDTMPYRDVGLLSVYAGTSGEKVEGLVRSVIDEFRRMKQEPVSAEELTRAKEQLKGSLTLSLESTGARMSNRSRQEIYFGRFQSLEEIFAEVDAVTREQVQELAREIFVTDRIALAALGRMDGFRPGRDLLSC